jgi:hypothetical protein
LDPLGGPPEPDPDRAAGPARRATEDLGLRALALHGERRKVARLTGSLALLR